MNFLTQLVHLGPIKFHLYYLLITVLILFSLFVIWLEGIKDGFDKERLFDMYFLPLVVWGVLVYAINFFAQFNLFLARHELFAMVVSFYMLYFISIKIFSKKYKYSVFRLLDIYSFIFFISVLALFAFDTLTNLTTIKVLHLLLFSSAFLVGYLNRNKILSGVVFSIYLLLFVIFGQFFYSDDLYLIFYFVLITISMVNLFFRNKKSMQKPNFNLDFLKRITSFLTKKKRNLVAEQKRLIEDDPYLQEGRDVGNAEEMDEAILEDRAKVEHDLKKRRVETSEKQVDKALDRLAKGEYGICEVCGEQIDHARLEAFPEATKCLACSSKAN